MKKGEGGGGGAYEHQMHCNDRNKGGVNGFRCDGRFTCLTNKFARHREGGIGGWILSNRH